MLCKLVTIILIIYLAFAKGKELFVGGTSCPDGTYQARCMRPDGSPVCVPMKK